MLRQFLKDVSAAKVYRSRYKNLQKNLRFYIKSTNVAFEILKKNGLLKEYYDGIRKD